VLKDGVGRIGGHVISQGAQRLGIELSFQGVEGLAQALDGIDQQLQLARARHDVVEGGFGRRRPISVGGQFVKLGQHRPQRLRQAGVVQQVGQHVLAVADHTRILAGMIKHLLDGTPVRGVAANAADHGFQFEIADGFRRQAAGLASGITGWPQQAEASVLSRVSMFLCLHSIPFIAA
jgi:hypothetical protein